MTFFTKLRNRVFPFHVDSVLASINSNLEKLQTVATKRRNMAADHTELANALHEEAAAHNAEADRAERVAAKLKELVS